MWHRTGPAPQGPPGTGSPHQLPPHGDTYFPAWIPSQVDDSFIRIRSLLIPASLYRSMRRWARATIASLSKESLRGQGRDRGAQQPARGCVACPAQSTLAGLIFKQDPEMSSSSWTSSHSSTWAPRGEPRTESSCRPLPASPVSALRPYLASTSVDTRPGIFFSISTPNSTKSLSVAFVICSSCDLKFQGKN